MPRLAAHFRRDSLERFTISSLDIGGVASARRAKSSRRWSFSSRLGASIVTPYVSILLLIKKLPAAERQDAIDLRSSVKVLASLVDDFDAALQLFATLNRNHGVPTGWKAIPLRDGASTIYEFGQVVAHMGSARSKCPVLASLLDEGEWKLGSKAFTKAFPKYEHIRNAALHAPQIFAKSDQRRRHRTKQETALMAGDVPAATLGAGMTGTVISGSTIRCAYNGQFAEYSLDQPSLDALRASASHFSTSFHGAEPMLLARPDLPDWQEAIRQPDLA